MNEETTILETADGGIVNVSRNMIMDTYSVTLKTKTRVIHKNISMELYQLLLKELSN